MSGTKEVLLDSFTDFWAKFTGFIPTLLLAIGLLLAGFIVAWLLEIVSRKVLRVIKLEEIIAKIGIKQLFEKAGLKMTFTRLLCGVVYWFVLIVFLATVVNILGLTQLSDFFDKLIGYLPNVLAAVVILIIGILVANALHTIVKNAAESARIASAKFLASLTKWSVFVFALMAAVVQLGIAKDLLNTLFTGFIAMIAIAGGLAFGLGGKEFAKDVLDKFRRDVS